MFNQHLEDIWDFKTHPNVTIAKGRISIHHNNRLCAHEIQELIEATEMANKTDVKDVSVDTNGYQGSCMSPLKANMFIASQLSCSHFPHLK